MSKTDELLAVLDVPEEEQRKWVNKYCNKEKIDNTILIPHPELGCEDYEIEISLADLAFRLRDETDRHDWETGLFEIYEYLASKQPKKKMLYTFGFWKTAFAQPIHWISAALKAKKLAEDKNGKA